MLKSSCFAHSEKAQIYNWEEIQMKRQNFRIFGLLGKKNSENFWIAHFNTMSYVPISNTRNLGTTAQDQTQDHILVHSVNLAAWSLVSHKIVKNYHKLLPFHACHMTRKILFTPRVYNLTIKIRGKRQMIKRNLKTILTVIKVTYNTSSTDRDFCRYHSRGIIFKHTTSEYLLLTKAMFSSSLA